MAINVNTIKSEPLRTGLPNIKTIGLGGGGGNVVNRMVKDGIKGVEYVSINTDAMALKSSLADITVTIGQKLTAGLGAGMKPDIGKAAAMEQIETLEGLLDNTDMLFLAAGMGGGTGTGSIPVMAELAREKKILTVAIVTTPFSFEGPKRARLAEAGLQELIKHVDTLVVIPNTKLLEVASPKTTMSEAFEMADDILKQAISGITNLINLEGLINLDFADLRTVMENKGSAYMGTGFGRGDNRGLSAVKAALSSPLITKPVDGATGIIINIVADEDFPLFDAEAAAEHVQNTANKDADVIFGLVYDPKLRDEVFVTVIATGYDPDISIAGHSATRKEPLRVADSLKHTASDIQMEDKPSATPMTTKSQEIDVPPFIRQHRQ